MRLADTAAEAVSDDKRRTPAAFWAAERRREIVEEAASAERLRVARERFGDAQLRRLRAGVETDPALEVGEGADSGKAWD